MGAINGKRFDSNFKSPTKQTDSLPWVNILNASFLEENVANLNDPRIEKTKKILIDITG
ncbi:hypothetical protein [Microcoleus sp. POL10_C6]|uniref:hypothetical protein n=1 Tax=unclassified Microcoleus TaxID=2642155 RepID=UPI002FD594AF